MRKRVLAFSVLGGLVALTLAVAPLRVFAEDGSNSGSNSGSGSGSGSHESTSENENTTETSNSTSSNKGKVREAVAERTHEHLAANKLRVCKNHETRINEIMGKRETQAQKQLDVFTKIYERVKAFYAEKGKTVANYDQLVAAVDQAKAKAEANIASLKATDTFKCDVEDPKAIVGDFKAAHQQLREDLKAYRTAIKNLIVAVKTAQGESSNEN